MSIFKTAKGDYKTLLNSHTFSKQVLSAHNVQAYHTTSARLLGVTTIDNATERITIML